MSRFFTDSGYADRRRVTNTRLLAASAQALVRAIDYAFEEVQEEIDAQQDSGPLVFTFAADAMWVVNHNLGRDVSVEVLSAGGARIGVEVLQYSLNQVRVYFEVPIPGRVLIR